MNISKVSRMMLDNSTVAGAGRALYNTSPDVTDCRSLMHMITAALICDEIHIDGSSREIPVRMYDAGTGEHRVTEPLPAIWTWERRYPAIANLSHVVDGFWQRTLGFNKDKIVDFALEVLGEGGPEHIKNLDPKLIPSIYLSDNYFDRQWLTSKKALFESQMVRKVTDVAFKILLYTWRGIYYYELSKLVGITYFAHPQRSQFIEPFMVAGKSIYDYDHTALTFLSKVLCEPAYKLVQAHATEKSKEFSISLFPFAAYILKDCHSSREEIVESVMKLRETSQLQELRSWVSEYDQAYRQTDILSLKKFQNKVNSSMRNFEKRFGVESVPLKIVPRMPINCLDITGLDQVSASLKLPGFLFTELFQKPYLSLMWDIAKHLLRGSLGLDKILNLSPITDRHRDVEWILMESTHGYLSTGDYYLKDHVAGPDDNNMYDFDNYFDLLAASARPAQETSSASIGPKHKKWKN
ncbi:MAG: hypothetical protein JW882_02915 [Deltaproteobacteria bacterium]|nr:hypothetical protein [Deltaproteobacteria bacterium]